MRGRIPKPTRVKMANGNPGKRRLNDAEPTYKPGAGSPPASLDAVGKAEWRRVSKLLTTTGVLTQADRGVLTMYCSAWSRWLKALKQVEETGGGVLDGEHGSYQNPWLAIANRASDTAAKLGGLLGLDPTSRSRVSGVKPKAVAEEKPKKRPMTNLDRLRAEGGA